VIIAYTNLKGGCGKSTLAAHSYGYLKREGVSRWLVDSDPQASSSDWLTGNDSEADCYHLTDPKDVSEASEERAKDNDVVIIDAAGTLNDISKTVMMIADVVMVPCRPSRMDYKATVEVLKLANQVNSIRKKPFTVMVIPMMVRTGETMTYQLMDALPNLDVPVAPSVSHRSAYVKAASDENFVWDQNDSKATAEIELLMEFIKENA
jgi:cellulose biosynthesis protein BcsQ